MWWQGVRGVLHAPKEPFRPALVPSPLPRLGSDRPRRHKSLPAADYNLGPSQFVEVADRAEHCRLPDILAALASVLTKLGLTGILKDQQPDQ